MYSGYRGCIFYAFEENFSVSIKQVLFKKKKIQMLNTDLAAIPLQKFNYQFFQFLRQLDLLLLMYALGLF